MPKCLENSADQSAARERCVARQAPWNILPDDASAAKNRTPCSNAEAMPNLGTTRTNNGTTAASAHAHKEAVGTLTAYNRWLIGAFHGDIP